MPLNDTFYHLALYLPPEIWSRVFMIVVHDGWFLRSSITPCVSLGHVCRYWRSVVLNDAKLWSRIDSFTTTPWYDSQLERSRNLPLRCRVKGDITGLSQLESDRIMKAMDHASRLHSFTFSIFALHHPNFLQATPILKRLYNTPFPVMKRLTLDICTAAFTHSPDLLLNLPKQNFPELRQLHVRYDTLIFSWTLPIFTGLQSLRLDTKAENLPVCTFGSFLDALERMPLLERMHFNWTCETLEEPETVDPSRVVSLPHLQSIHLRAAVLRECVNLISHIRYPQETIKIRFRFQAEGDENENRWYNEGEISTYLVTPLACALQSSFLSNSLNPSASSTTSHSRSPTWSCVHPHPSGEDTRKRRSGNVPIPSLHFTYEVQVDHDLRMDDVRKRSLSILPLSDLQSIALDHELPTEVFKMLADLPHLNIIALMGNSCCGFFRYLDSEYKFTQDETNIDAGANSSATLANAPLFPSLTALSLENTIFEPRSAFVVSAECQIRTDHILGFLRLRKDTLGLPIQRIRFTRCLGGLSSSFMEDVEALVPDVHWDGISVPICTIYDNNPLYWSSDEEDDDDFE
ncbi:hypothetical protein CVT24_006942 [Panaeolus cyanescens]|uniref:F-box domain-containing protein n=1 Tax=Panaeolus cyanescens TaxID=181874 RepID=A0A409W019_9AGAR|nr:hypothetical protein CVT24_006942 [Panaeolus cyanescens]